MVTFKPVGRLGNFLFEAANCLSYAWEHNLTPSIPSNTNDTYWNPIYLQHLVHPDFDPSLPLVTINERVFSHHVRPFEEKQWQRSYPNGYNISLNGYWQTEKYFRHVRGRLLKSFDFEWAPLPKVVSVHVRRGDYLTVKKGSMLKHPPVSPEWYKAQMRKFPQHQFAFFSDDLAYCEETFGAFGGVMMGVIHTFQPDAPKEVRDLIGMSLCEHHICSASTFSWWGAWLNQNPRKRVIMPKHWITPGWSDLDMKDIVPQGWERA